MSTTTTPTIAQVPSSPSAPATTNSNPAVPSLGPESTLNKKKRKEEGKAVKSSKVKRVGKGKTASAKLVKNPSTEELCDAKGDKETKDGGSLEDDTVRKAARHTEKIIAAQSKYKYATEIQQMIFVFGEVTDPVPETVMLIEDIVRSQVIEIIIQGAVQAHRRGSRHMNAEDLIFLIRHDRAKCNRLRTYLSWKDVRKNVKDASKSNEAGADEILESEELLKESNAEKPVKVRKRFVKLSWDLIGGFQDVLNEDENDDGDENEMEVYRDTLQRLKDADEVTKKMTKEEYVHYSECRQASFTYRKSKKFRDWANMADYVDVKPNDDIIDILGFLTFEMVSTLTTKALEMKEEEENKNNCSPHAVSNAKDTKDERQVNDASGSLSAVFTNIHDSAYNVETMILPAPTSQMTCNSLFSLPLKEQTPLQPHHLQEAFRRMQLKQQESTGTFIGGLRRTRIGLI